MKIFIDPGHGGRDPGAVGRGQNAGLREADIALSVSRRLAELLTNHGFETRLSRTGDSDLTINSRWQDANAWRADYFISVHVNAGGGTGAETFIAATKQNNKEFAAAVNNEYCEAMGLRNRGVRLDTMAAVGALGVLRHSNMPAILVELAFIDAPSDRPDANILRNRQECMARALADGVCGFLKPVSPPSSLQGVKYLDRLMDNAHKGNRLHDKIQNGITDLDTALKVLTMAGIMNSPDYWMAQSRHNSELKALLIQLADKATDPLARIIWAEARGEDERGQVLVGNVVLNRHRGGGFPRGIYNVLHQPNQFEPMRNGAYDRATPSAQNTDAAIQALNNDHSRGALFFRATAGMAGSWHERSLQLLFAHGGHSFFK